MCTISTAALARRFEGRKGAYPGHVMAFLLLREEIEEAAGYRYAQGASPPRLD